MFHLPEILTPFLWVGLADKTTKNELVSLKWAILRKQPDQSTPVAI